MADFKSHITTSTMLGIGYGVAGHFYLELSPPTCVVAAGLCGVSGMMPDLDSDSGVPVRETMSFLAAVTPMLMIERFVHMGLSHESIACVGVLVYLAIRFGVAEIFKRYTVHRGMWHSIPAAMIAGLLAFLICGCEDLTARIFKSCAVVAGFMSHLVLDEIWSIQIRGVVPRFKRSFGTAMKLWGDSTWGNISTYAKLFVLLAMAAGDPLLMHWLGVEDHSIPKFAKQWVDDLKEQGRVLQR